MFRRLILTTAAAVLTACAVMAQTKVVCHRGYWRADGSAQNSIRSLAKADSIRAFGSELDVWMTNDGKLVVNHDAKFKGVDIEASTYDQARAIRLDNGEQLPSLDEYLEAATRLGNGTRIVLEMKSLKDLKREDECAAKIVECMKRHGVVDNTDIIAFSINACLAFRKLLPDTKVFYLDNDLSPRKIKSLGLAGIDYEQTTLRQHPEWVSQAHSLGMEVNVWTVDNKEAMRYFIGLGVDYITTNEPVVLQRLLAEE